MREIESTSRLYCEGMSRIMTTPLLVNTDSDEPVSTEISFVLHRGWLVTLRDSEPQSFRQTIGWLAKRRREILAQDRRRAVAAAPPDDRSQMRGRR